MNKVDNIQREWEYDINIDMETLRKKMNARNIKTLEYKSIIPLLRASGDLTPLRNESMSLKICKTKCYYLKRKKIKIELTICVLWNNIKKCIICIIGIPEAKKKRWTRNIWLNTSWELSKINCGPERWTKEVQRTPKGIDKQR